MAKRIAAPIKDANKAAWNATLTRNWRYLVNEKLKFLGKELLPDGHMNHGRVFNHVWIQTGKSLPVTTEPIPSEVERWFVAFCHPHSVRSAESSPHAPRTTHWASGPLTVGGVDVRSSQFLRTFEWRTLRYDFLKGKKSRCEACGRNPRDHSIVINVDHIYPRRKYPQWAMEARNLQMLCDDCNHGKANGFEMRWERYL